MKQKNHRSRTRSLSCIHIRGVSISTMNIFIGLLKMTFKIALVFLFYVFYKTK